MFVLIKIKINLEYDLELHPDLTLGILTFILMQIFPWGVHEEKNPKTINKQTYIHVATWIKKSLAMSESNLSKTGSVKTSGGDSFHASVMSSVQPFPATDGIWPPATTSIWRRYMPWTGVCPPMRLPAVLPHWVSAAWHIPGAGVCFYVVHIMVLAWIAAH